MVFVSKTTLFFSFFFQLKKKKKGKKKLWGPYVCVCVYFCVCVLATASAAAAVLTCIIYGLPALLCSGTLLFFVGVKRARRVQQHRLFARSFIAAVA